jgi:hypothetical protein
MSIIRSAMPASVALMKLWPIFRQHPHNIFSHPFNHCVRGISHVPTRTWKWTSSGHSFASIMSSSSSTMIMPLFQTKWYPISMIHNRINWSNADVDALKHLAVQSQGMMMTGKQSKKHPPVVPSIASTDDLMNNSAVLVESIICRHTPHVVFKDFFESKCLEETEKNSLHEISPLLLTSLSPNPEITNTTCALYSNNIFSTSLSVSTLLCMNRNARRGKRANRGKRPVSRVRRRQKRRAYGNHRR